MSGGHVTLEVTVFSSTRAEIRPGKVSVRKATIVVCSGDSC